MDEETPTGTHAGTHAGTHGRTDARTHARADVHASTLTGDEAAALLGKSPDTVRRYMGGDNDSFIFGPFDVRLRNHCPACLPYALRRAFQSEGSALQLYGDQDKTDAEPDSAERVL